MTQNPAELMLRAHAMLKEHGVSEDHSLMVELDHAVGVAIQRAIPLGIKGGTMSFDVIGKPKGQGNMMQAPNGKMIHKQDGALRKWQRLVAKAAEVARGGAKPLPKRIPVALGLEFRLPLTTKYGVSRLKTAVPGEWCLLPPDIDKLARAALDAMTGVVWTDDCQVVAWLQPNGKRWIREDEQPGCRVTVAQLG